MRVGTLAEARTLVPDVHIYTRSKQPWVDLPGAGVGSTTGKPPPVCEAYYDIEALWPAESLTRRKALFA